MSPWPFRGGKHIVWQHVREKHHAVKLHLICCLSALIEQFLWVSGYVLIHSCKLTEHKFSSATSIGNCTSLLTTWHRPIKLKSLCNAIKLAMVTILPWQQVFWMDAHHAEWNLWTVCWVFLVHRYEFSPNQHIKAFRPIFDDSRNNYQHCWFWHQFKLHVIWILS